MKTQDSEEIGSTYLQIQDGLGLPIASQTPIPDDPWDFILSCAFTYDELAETLGLEPKRPFPDKPYLKLIVAEWMANPSLRVEKSRQIMVTWLLAALWLWWVLKKPGQRVAWICKTFSDASDHIEKRVYRMYEQIPATCAKPRAEFVEGEFRVYHDEASTIPTSLIEAIAAERGRNNDAASQLRSFTYSGINWDEAGFQPNQDEIYAAGLPCVGSGGRFNVVSSANGPVFFYRLGHGNLDDESNQVQQDIAVTKDQLMRGVTAWQHNGFRHLRVHYTADSDKDPDTETGAAWLAAIRPRYSTRKWKREMEIDFTVPAGLPVYDDTDKIVAVTQMYDPNLVVFAGLDFGFTETACVFSQVEPILDPQTQKPVRLILHTFKEIIVNNVTIGKFAEEHLLSYVRRVLPRAKIEWYGDPAGHQRSDKSPLSSIETLATFGIIVKTSAALVDTRLEVCQSIISAGDCEVDPAFCPKLLAALRGGYHRDDHGLPVKDGEFDHVCDAWGYKVFNVLGLNKRAASGSGARSYTPPPAPTTQPTAVNPLALNRELTHRNPSVTKPKVEAQKHTDRVFIPKPFEWRTRQ